jgi:uncharacterized protein (DUF885 family)
MRSMTISVALATMLFAALPMGVALASGDIEARVVAQNLLFEEWYQFELSIHPEQATAYGDYRYNDRLDGRSLAARRAEYRKEKQVLARVDAIPTRGFSDRDAMSHEALVRELQQRLADFAFKEYEMPVSQMEGPHLALADLPLAVPFESVRHYEDYLARLHQIPHALEETEEVLRAGLRDHLMPVRFLLEKVPAQCDGIIAANPFLRPTRTFPPGISMDDQERLTRAITDTVSREVLPAYRAFGEFIRTEYAPHGRTTLAVTSLPRGRARYLNDIRSRTTVSTLSPDQIHELGLKEIARIEADMRVIAQREGFGDLAAYRASLQTNPRYRPDSSEAILADFRKYLAQMQPRLPDLFGYIPASPVTVEAIPDFQAAMATHYQTGTPDGRRPGRVIVATSHFAERSLIDDEATAYHEGVPGHHMQRSVAQQMTDLPKFRQHLSNSGYTEGWALYAEQLGKEVGFYQDPASDFGRLMSELFRADRLVVDTGIHSMGWTREQVVEFLRQGAAIDEPTIQSETDRYIAWPGQALAYKLGQLKFRELRDRAERELGARFEIRRFHDEMLSGGVLPLDLLDARTNAWIRTLKATDSTAIRSPSG